MSAKLMVILVGIAATLHLFVRDYPFGGVVQTLFDLFILTLVAVTVGRLLIVKIDKERSEPPVKKRQNTLKETD
ncbi:hypothetical protein ACFO4L_05305 [Bacillus daqingensis]|uniref:Uncharacterized protein n=1 Tax=Bacillus daqingensis TaxID=872396 RepID=A0ABV9NVP4_9BACI